MEKGSNSSGTVPPRIPSQVPLLSSFNVRELFIPAPTTGAQILGEDWRRIGLIIQNLGVNDVYIRADHPADVGVGLYLAPGSIPFELKFKDFGVLLTRPWFAVADIMDSDLVIYETIYTPLRGAKL